MQYLKYRRICLVHPYEFPKLPKVNLNSKECWLAIGGNCNKKMSILKVAISKTHQNLTCTTEVSITKNPEVPLQQDWLFPLSIPIFSIDVFTLPQSAWVQFPSLLWELMGTANSCINKVKTRNVLNQWKAHTKKNLPLPPQIASNYL